MPRWLEELLPIVCLLVVVTVVVARLPKVDLGHTPEFRRRRFLNWFPVGLTYAFLYMARYNLNACIGPLYDKTQYYEIDSWGTLVYGLGFLVTGPLTDRIGGRRTTMLAAGGSAFATVLMGLAAQRALDPSGVVPREAQAGLVPTFSALYALNMFFQSFGAVSIVKVNSAWFHLRERGTFGGIFGILISLGLYFAFDWSSLLVKYAGVTWAFYVPAAILLVFLVLDFLLVRDTPGDAGLVDFALGDATEADDAPRLPLRAVVKKMVTNRTILTIAAIELCSGFLRSGIMKTYKPFAKETGRLATDFVEHHWGMLNCMAGILGGVAAGLISDRLFNHRRGPVSAVLYGVMLAGSLAMIPALTTPAAGGVLVLMTLAIIGVHGMLSGTASMDFGGKRNVGVVVGVIDGCVYLGQTVCSRVYKGILPTGEAAKSAENWSSWPLSLAIVSTIGLLLALRVWNARPAGSAHAAH